MRQTMLTAIPVLASLPPGRKTLPSNWCRGEFAPGTTLLARELKRAFREQRGLKNQDDRLQREERSYARWSWHNQIWESLREPGTA